MLYTDPELLALVSTTHRPAPLTSRAYTVVGQALGGWGRHTYTVDAPNKKAAVALAREYAHRIQGVTFVLLTVERDEP